MILKLFIINYSITLNLNKLKRLTKQINKEIISSINAF